MFYVCPKTDVSELKNYKRTPLGRKKKRGGGGERTAMSWNFGFAPEQLSDIVSELHSWEASPDKRLDYCHSRSVKASLTFTISRRSWQSMKA